MPAQNNSYAAAGFSRFATRAAAVVGSPGAFIFGMATVVAWLVVGPRFHFSDAWQLVMNSWSNILTFLIVFLIQNTQNRDSKAINLKLDEVIRASHHAENELIDIEKLSDGDLEELEKRYERIRQEYDERKHRQRGDMRNL
jgi:low affinity Fe/Cu permease